VLKRLREFHREADAQREMSAETLRRLEWLLSAPEVLPAAFSVAEAAHLSRDFEAYYNHLVPFRRDALAEIWRRCSGPAAECEAGRASTERALGPLVSP
jgi:hypothetical protein